MSSTRQGERPNRSTLCFGPAVSLILALAHIIQTILNDPTEAFSEEIFSKLEAPSHPEGQPREHSSGYFSLFRSKPYSEQPNTSRYLLTSRGERESEQQQSLRLFRPSVWPYEGMIETPPLNAVQGGQFPGESSVLTDYINDTIVDVFNFMEMDPIERTIVPIERDESISYATCRFMDYQYAFHFSHFAQQLFRCWSFFRANLDKSPVFVGSPKEYYWKLAMEKEFNRELLGVLEYAGVRVLNASETMISYSKEERSISGWTKGPILGPKETHFQMASKDDMPSFRGYLMASQNLTNILPSFCGRTSGFPRIAILTRQRLRRIKNVKDLAISLQQHYKLDHEIPVIHFERAPFRNQAAVMGSIDILVTPHGAQETGIAFMPRCACVLELLPDNYFFPRFYGTLASTAGIQHAYMYLAKNTSDETVDVKDRDVGFMYPSFGKVQEGVDLLLEQWRGCCNASNPQELHAKDLLRATDDEQVFRK